jgi:transposase
MIWGAFSNDTIFDLHIMEGTYNSAKNTDMLGKCLLPFMQPDWVFMQDNASIHRSLHTKKWIDDSQIKVLEWPANSPDLNPIENLWGLLARAVYANGRQFNSREELKSEVLKQWDLMCEETLTTLVKSMPNRIIEVISLKGSNTGY